MHREPKYVTRRVNRNGRARYYWQRPGHPLARLPDDPAERAYKAHRWNQAADRGAGSDSVAYGTLAWVVRRYQASTDYDELSEGTKKYYRRFLREIEALGPDEPFQDVTRAVVVDFVSSFSGAGQRRQAAAVFRQLFHVAMHHGLVGENRARHLKLKAPAARARFWTTEEINAWLATAREQGFPEWLIAAFMLLRYTAQRPTDVLAMTWSALDDEAGTIWLTQEKTDTPLAVPLHPALRDYLATLDREASPYIVAGRGSGISYAQFVTRFKQVTDAAGIEDAQPRDLRRTAVVAMAEGGATAAQISAVTGHSLDATHRILETYMPRTTAMAREGISRLEGGGGGDGV